MKRANQMRILALNQRYSVLASAMLPTAGDPVGKTVDRIGRFPYSINVRQNSPLNDVSGIAQNLGLCVPETSSA